MVRHHLICALIELEHTRWQVQKDLRQALNNEDFELPDFIDSVLDLLGVPADTTLEVNDADSSEWYDRGPYYECYTDNRDCEPAQILDALKKLSIKDR